MGSSEKEELLQALYELFHEYCEVNEQLFAVLSKEDQEENLKRNETGYKKAAEILRKNKRI